MWCGCVTVTLGEVGVGVEAALVVLPLLGWFRLAGVLVLSLILKSLEEFCEGMSIRWLGVVGWPGCCCWAPGDEAGAEMMGSRPRLSMYLMLSLLIVSLLVCSWLPRNRWGMISVGISLVGLSAFGEWQLVGVMEMGAGLNCNWIGRRTLVIVDGLFGCSNRVL